MLTSKKFLILMSGSIACYKICDLISQLKQLGHEVQVCTSPSALKFVGELSLEALSGRSVFSNPYATGKAMDHIHHMRWADKILLAPASANTLNSMAAGISSNILCDLFLAHDFEKSFFFAPAMNTKMFQHPSTKASIEKLKSWGLIEIEPHAGRLACGEEGIGRMAEPKEILEALVG